MKRKALKEKKRREAEERQMARGKRTDEQQLAKLDAEGWEAGRERARLHKGIESRRNQTTERKVRDKTCVNCGDSFRGNLDIPTCPRCDAKK